MQIIEIILPAITAVLVCCAGMLVFRWWGKRDEAPPVWVVAGMWVAALIVYLGVTRYLWLRADANIDVFLPFGEPGALEQRITGGSELQSTRIFPILVYCFLLWVIPLLYFTPRFLRSFEVRQMDLRTWLAMKIPDDDTYPDSHEFTEARELAMMGDINGAVSKYRTSATKRVLALFSAARLLEADGRNEEAGELFREIANQSQSDLRTWAEAMFCLAKVTEKSLSDKGEAISLLNQIVVRAPDTEHGQMASSLLARLQPGGDALLDMLDEAYDTPNVPPLDDTEAMTLDNPIVDEGDAAES